MDNFQCNMYRYDLINIHNCTIYNVQCTFIFFNLGSYMKTNIFWQIKKHKKSLNPGSRDLKPNLKYMKPDPRDLKLEQRDLNTDV